MSSTLSLECPHCAGLIELNVQTGAPVQMTMATTKMDTSQSYSRSEGGEWFVLKGNRIHLDIEMFLRQTSQPVYWGQVRDWFCTFPNTEGQYSVRQLGMLVLDEVYPEISFSESGVSTLDLVRIMRKLGIDVDRINDTGALDELYPEISKEWHPEKNDDSTPSGITDRSRKKVWWLCPQGPDHEWMANPYDRTSGGRGCPFCSGRRVSQTNSFDAQFPWLADWWHPEKNGSLKPTDVFAGSNRSVWGICPEGPDHEWRAKVNGVTRGRGCPYCRGMMASVTNSLATMNPELAAQWNPAKNGSLTAAQVVSGSGKRVWWKCHQNLGHEWESTVISRMKGTGCPFCREAM